MAMPSALFASHRLICPLAKVKRKFIANRSARTGQLKYWHGIHVSLAVAVGMQRAAYYRVGTCTNNSFIDVRPQTHHPQAFRYTCVCVCAARIPISSGSN
jgi:hypothetical protein